MAAPDRLSRLMQQTALGGLDFVFVHDDQRTLDVYFHVDPAAMTPPLASRLTEPAQVRIHAEDGSVVPVTGLAWIVGVAGRPALQVSTARPGGFVPYRLRLVERDDPGRDLAAIDPFFNDVVFSFKASCPRDVDCEPPAHECPPEPAVDAPVDYLARDFHSFRRALLDFASLRHPEWQDRLEADVGVMLAELVSAVADEAAYLQDRAHRESTLATASQRRSLRRHARLVDYVIHDGLAARGWLSVICQAGASGHLEAGCEVVARSDGGASVTFEVGELAEALAVPPRRYPVDARRNPAALVPHVWDESATCLPVGARELHLVGHHAAILQPHGERRLLLATRPAPGRPERRHLVRLETAIDERDPLLGVDVTRVIWAPEHALPFELDLEILEVAGNLVPISAGRTFQRVFAIRAPLVGDAVASVERTGPDGSIAHLLSLPGSETEGLVHLGDDPASARPEIDVTPVTWNGLAWTAAPPAWSWRRALLGPHSSQPRDEHFTLDDGQWRRVVGYQRPGGEIVFRDYAEAGGVSVRFGDGEFGKVPAPGSYFRVTYRVGNGRRGNLAAGTLRELVGPVAPGLVAEVDNPLELTGGVDPESSEEIRRLAPEAFRAVTYRAVRAEDYAEAAERLPWVQRAGASFRWTGSWLSAFVAADPRGEAAPRREQRRQLGEQLDRFRQTGREVHVLAPRYVDLDLEIDVCVAATAYRGDVSEAVLAALTGGKSPWSPPGFFHPDRFTFGTPLERAALEAAIQAVNGVSAVEGIRLRRRGWFDWRPLTELRYRVAPGEVIRVMNDPTHPERGSLKIKPRGGA